MKSLNYFQETLFSFSIQVSFLSIYLFSWKVYKQNFILILAQFKLDLNGNDCTDLCSFLLLFIFSL